MSTQIRATCLCGQLTVTSTVPASKLPLELYLCACNTCRWLSGTLAISSVNLHHPISIQGTFTRYATSTGPRGLDRCFCPVCGTYVFEDCPDVSRIGLFGGAMEKVDDGLVKLKGTIYAASTEDGGLTVWMPGQPAWVEDSKGKDVQEYVPPAPETMQGSNQPTDAEEMLQCACHCGNIQLKISRPNAESYGLSARYSDSIVPFHTGAEHLNARNEKWWVRGSGPMKKYAAAVCACNTCRRASGQDLVQWAFIPETNIIIAEGQKGLGEYQSSKGVTRSFCRTCGARVFWMAEDRPGLIDVAVGLMRSGRGSRAEDWLEWLTQRISFVEDRRNKELVGAVRDGMRQYHDTQTAE